MIDLATFTDEVVEELGSPLQSELSYTNIENAISKGLREYSRYKPKRVYRTLQLVAGVSEYTVGSDVMSVSEVVFAQYKYLGDVLSEYPTVRNLDGLLVGDIRNLSLVDNPSLGVIVYQKLQSISEMLGNDWEYHDGTLLLYPAPIEDGLLVYNASLQYQVTDVPADDAEVIKDFVLGTCLVLMSRKRNKKIKAIPTDGGTLSFDDGSAMKKEGQELIEKFYKNMGKGLTAIVTG